MNNNQKNEVLVELLKSLELPDSAYEKAIERYEHLGEWFARDDSTVKLNDPHIFPQGSFRLGTAIKPIDTNENYDLDLACSIRQGFSQQVQSQKNLKDAIGAEIEAYRASKGIQAEKEEKHRCWRLEYADKISFHMDIVPCIPNLSSSRVRLQEAMQEESGLDQKTSEKLSNLAVLITDNTLPNYSNISDEWPISNPEGYAKWFEMQMSKSPTNKSVFVEAQVDDVPIFRRKSPLQMVVKLLKRHRDIMFKHNSDSKPISVIITTITANSYSGTTSLEMALHEALSALSNFAKSNSSIMLNPVNPDENFADKWLNPKYTQLQLKQNFHNWVSEVNRHFSILLTSNDVQRLTETASDAFAVTKNPSDWSGISGISVAPTIITSPQNLEGAEAKPWGGK